MEKFFYRVERGDTVCSVAEKFSVPAAILIKQNNLIRELSAGDLLYIEKENYRLYKVKPFETAETIAKKFSVPKEKILSDNGLTYLFYGIVIKI